ncbi:C-3 sterol dehydrogenase/C-4 decarboxylase-like protein [Amniculicola lignicola CBS 123094]|uniref:C-3 sterol dehydrogenase/C-4 decarboxylase-like protein n=1 Tax=Amniculicola lignicola CBS 123094 TaxID=1392246 RepID=A0A6A5W808_9PLEO|nr:C-3 sterol dehydrogenase/C-4 decarboxylase-like protein [Amniculicola lignicola CBS 123094]
MSPITNLGTILVTGGAGWMGSCIVESLLVDGSFSQVVSSVEPQATSNRQVDGAVYHYCDLSDQVQLKALLDKFKPRVILHTIGPGFFAPPQSHYLITYEQSRLMLVTAKKHPSVQALVYTSTAEAVALKPSHNDHPVREDEVGTYALDRGPMAYSRTKAAVDILVREANTPKAFDDASGNYRNTLLTAVLRVTGLYGPRDKLTIIEMLKLVNTPKTKFQIGPNKLRHDWIFVESCARAHVLAAKALIHPTTTERADGQAFNVSDNSPIKFWDFARSVLEEAGDANWAPDGPHKVVQIPFWAVLLALRLLEWIYWIFTFGMMRPSSSTHTFAYMKTGCWFDISKARRVLGYEPLCDTHEGIKKTIQWMRENGHLGDKKRV